MSARTSLPWLSLLALLVLLTTALLGPLLAPRDPAAQQLTQRLRAPDREHVLGTDHLGRDVLSRLIVGARSAIAAAFPAIALAALFGITIGAFAGLLGGVFETVAIAISDALQVFPPIVLALCVLALSGSGSLGVWLALALAFFPGYLRLARAEAARLRNAGYVEASRALGAGSLTQLRLHVLPNLAPFVIVLLALDAPAAITLEAGLAFLGLGVPPPTPTWGNMLADGFARIRQSIWPVLWPALALSLTALALTNLGESLRDKLAKS